VIRFVTTPAFDEITELGFEQEMVQARKFGWSRGIFKEFPRDEKATLSRGRIRHRRTARAS
jgi:hypothetical protein